MHTGKGLFGTSNSNIHYLLKIHRLVSFVSGLGWCDDWFARERLANAAPCSTRTGKKAKRKRKIVCGVGKRVKSVPSAGSLQQTFLPSNIHDRI